MRGTGGWRLGHRPALDGLRGIAILLVIGNHAGVPGFEHAGQIGVTVFFVLSGFLITSILLEERLSRGTISLARFYWHRALRLLPALGTMILVAVPLLAWTSDASVGNVVPALFYFSNWQQIAAAHDAPIVGHAWSLSVEEQFYLVWPLLLVALIWLVRDRRWIAAILGIGAVLVIVERTLLWQPTAEGFYRVFYGSDTRADALLLGAALAFLFSVAPRVPGRSLTAGSVAVLAVTILVPQEGFRATIGFGAAALVTCVLLAKAAVDQVQPLAYRPLAWIGLVSYALYLWHVPMLHVFQAWLGEGIAASVAGVLATFVVAAASRRWIELPARRWRRPAPSVPLPRRATIGV